MECRPGIDVHPTRQLEAAALALRDGRLDTVPPGILAERVGRNAVWRLSLAGGRRYYAKVWRNSAEYEREYFGLEQAGRLALGDKRFIAASIVYSDQPSGIIITTEIQGVSVGTLFRDAYRIDRNPFGRSEPRRILSRAVDATVAWLDAFHQATPPTAEFLLDHSIQGVARRIEPKVALYSSRPPDVAVAQRLVANSSSTIGAAARLLFGDVSLGNFIFDGERLGAVDFEDIGLGPSARDFAVLRYRIEEALESPLYVFGGSVLQSIPLSAHGASDGEDGRALFEAELCVQRLEAFGVRPSGALRSHKRLRERLSALLVSAAGVRDGRKADSL